MSFAWVAVGSTVGTIGSSYLQSRSSAKAAEAQLQAAQMAGDTEREMYYQSREDVAPWREAGGEGLNYLQNMLGIGAPSTLERYKPQREDFTNLEDYQNALNQWRATDQAFQENYGSLTRIGPEDYVESPYYNFLLDKGTEARKHAASAGGGIESGRTYKALTEYGQNLASQDYGDWLNRKYQSIAPYQSMAGVGQSTATQMGQNALNLGTSLANNAMYAGGVQAQNYMNQGDIWSNALTGLTNLGTNYAFGKYMGYM